MKVWPLQPRDLATTQRVKCPRVASVFSPASSTEPTPTPNLKKISFLSEDPQLLVQTTPTTPNHQNSTFWISPRSSSPTKSGDFSCVFVLGPQIWVNLTHGVFLSQVQPVPWTVLFEISPRPVHSFQPRPPHHFTSPSRTPNILLSTAHNTKRIFSRTITFFD